MIESIPILKCYFSDNLSIYMCISQLHKHPFSYTSEICVTEQKKTLIYYSNKSRWYFPD